MDKWLSTQYNRTNSPKRNKRFGLATWVLGWGLYKTYSTIKHIKDNIRTLQEQNLLQQDQIIELAFTFWSRVIIPRVSFARFILISLIVATVYFTNLISLRVAIKVLFISANLTCKLVIAYLLDEI